jgi:hypothetical protein
LARDGTRTSSSHAATPPEFQPSCPLPHSLPITAKSPAAETLIISVTRSAASPSLAVTERGKSDLQDEAAGKGVEALLEGAELVQPLPIPIFPDLELASMVGAPTIKRARKKAAPKFASRAALVRRAARAERARHRLRTQSEKLKNKKLDEFLKLIPSGHRAAVRRLLTSMRTLMQGHHLIPVEHFRHPLVLEFIRFYGIGFLNDVLNFMPLPTVLMKRLPKHVGSHKTYAAEIRDLLNRTRAGLLKRGSKEGLSTIEDISKLHPEWILEARDVVLAEARQIVVDWKRKRLD